jgi:hypothetical protein
MCLNVLQIIAWECCRLLHGNVADYCMGMLQIIAWECCRLLHGNVAEAYLKNSHHISIPVSITMLIENMQAYTCVRCGYNTLRKSSMLDHLVHRKKPCPTLRADIELTAEIKQHILDNRVYHPNEENGKSIQNNTSIDEQHTNIIDDLTSTLRYIFLLDGGFELANIRNQSRDEELMKLYSLYKELGLTPYVKDMNDNEIMYPKDSQTPCSNYSISERYMNIYNACNKSNIFENVKKQ